VGYFYESRADRSRKSRSGTECTTLDHGIHIVAHSGMPSFGSVSNATKSPLEPDTLMSLSTRIVLTSPCPYSNEIDRPTLKRMHVLGRISNWRLFVPTTTGIGSIHLGK